MTSSYRGGSRSSPVHYYIDDSAYFITAATYHHQSLLDSKCKDHLCRLLHEIFPEYGWRLDHWVVLDDHYHVMANSHYGRDLSRIINKIHHLSARYIKLHHPPVSRPHDKIWSNYWDYCPRDEQEYHIRLCYLLNNPVKHGYVKDLAQWKWSSFHQLLKVQGDEALRHAFRQHREYRDLALPEDP